MRGLFCILAVLWLAGCATRPSPATQKPGPAAWNAEAIAAQATDTEVRLRRRGSEEAVARVSSQRVRLLVDTTRRIEKVAGTTATVMLIESERPNAFATTGKDGINRIGFTLGMLELIGDDQDGYAAIVGHELAHLTLGHRAARLQRAQAGAVAGTVAAVLLGVAGVPGGGQLASIAVQGATTVFSREEERDADRYGISYAMQAGFDPKGAVRVWEQMAARSAGPGVPFLSTHPMPAERIEYLRDIAEGRQPRVQTAATLRYERLRLLGALEAGEALPAGELFIDLNTIAYNNRPNSKRAWLVLNAAGAGAEKSQKVQVLANCAIGSLSVTERISTAEAFGAGGELGRSGQIHVLGDANLPAPWGEALKMICT